MIKLTPNYRFRVNWRGKVILQKERIVPPHYDNEECYMVSGWTEWNDAKIEEILGEIQNA